LFVFLGIKNLLTAITRVAENEASGKWKEKGTKNPWSAGWRIPGVSFDSFRVKEVNYFNST